ncbi:hypothetical protein F8M41_022539 [Gigaspora margarita]|uniref:Uncharacterized protein n=1 Tax=Gigaspora margarita TaxID=4874 RepID=A0A8H4EVY0_GIGMA|nr:hypothetical protein F8M41_022539 [Gigaspora margarita]
MIGWNNKTYPFGFNCNWDDYLVENPVYFKNLQNKVTELATFTVRIMSIPPTLSESKDSVNATNSNETCLEEIVSNIEFDDMDNSDNNLEQFEEENVMQTIANIDNFNTNDQMKQ